jgi:hypothetical protein
MPKRLDGNEMEENKDVDTRRYEAEDDEGHLQGSNLSHFNDRKARDEEDNDKSKLNKWDNRDEFHDTTRRDL